MLELAGYYKVLKRQTEDFCIPNPRSEYSDPLRDIHYPWREPICRPTISMRVEVQIWGMHKQSERCKQAPVHLQCPLIKEDSDMCVW